MTSANYQNQTAIFDPKSFAWPVHIVGAGSIGSSVLFSLTAMGVSDIHIWDADKLEIHNTPAQPIYRVSSDLGAPKVAAASDFVARQELNAKITTHQEFVGENTALSGVVISGVDSMRARKDIFAAVMAHSAEIPLYMDGRIGGEILHLLTFMPLADREFRKYYESEELYPDENAKELPCGGRNIIGPPMVLGGICAHNLTLWHRNLPFPRNVYINLRTAQFDIFQI